MKINKVALTDFSLRHFKRDGAGTKILDMTPDEFEARLVVALGQNPKIIEGYAQFCKLLFVENKTSAKVGSMPITIENSIYLRSGYTKRRDGELPYLTRSFYLPFTPPTAKYLCIVLYSREQLEKEHKTELNNKGPFEFDNKDIEWGVVSILAQNENEEQPMTPETCIRNSMDIKYGGSGVSFNEESYLKSVEFWSKNALISGWSYEI